MKIDQQKKLAALLIAYAAAVAIGYWYWCGKYDAISAWSVAITGAVILWYTWETMQLRRAAYLQYDAQLRPFILFRKDNENFLIENIGTGAALNIRLDTIHVSSEHGMRIEFPESVPVLKSGCQVEIKVRSIANEKETEAPVWAHLDPQHALLHLEVRIHFSNVEGKKYALVETVSPKLLSVIGFRDESTL